MELLKIILPIIVLSFITGLYIGGICGNIKDTKTIKKIIEETGNEYQKN